MLKRIVFFLALIICLAPQAQATDHYPVTVTDAANRQVTIASEPKAVLLGTGFNLIALSLVHPDPVSILSGWAKDLMGDNPEIYQAFKTKFPKIEQLPIVSDGITITTEAALSVTSDLVILAKWQASTETGGLMIRNLEKLGIPTIVIDFNEDALNNTASNIRLLGQVLNRVEQADAYADFFEVRLKRLKDRSSQFPDSKPTVLLTAFPDVNKCCYVFGASGLGEFITLAGGKNVADALQPHGGTMNVEAIMVANPQILIATSSPGGTYAELSVGPGVKESEARATLNRTIVNPFLVGSKAVETGRVHGLWNFFNAVPINILAAEAFAKWINPEIFADIDPDATLKEINERFAAVPFEGAYWVDLNEKKK